jgi:hypothetical protein
MARASPRTTAICKPKKTTKTSNYRSALNAWVMAIAEFSFIVPSNPEPRTSPRVCSLRSTAK